MTVIAWDGEALAGDRQCDWSGTKVCVRKVWRIVGQDSGTWLLGGSGDMDLVLIYLDWFIGKGDKPTFTEKDNFSALLVNEKKRVYLVNKSLMPVPLLQEQAAIGSGRGEALAAMQCGKSSAEAVLIAGQIDSGVGMGVDVVRFE